MKGARGGFTLMEVLLAGAIAVLMTLALMEGIIVAAKISRENSQLLAAEAFAWDTAWKWLNKAYDDTKTKLDAYKQGLQQLEDKKKSGEQLTEQEQRQYDSL